MAIDLARNTVTSYADVEIGAIAPSRLNPRKRFDDDALAELADSIRRLGVLEPVLLRDSKKAGPPFTLIAGERRWRAARRAGLTTIPARILAGITDQQALEIALIENLQRRDLDPIEEAEGYRQLHEVLHLKQREIAERVGKSQPAIANAIRLLSLPEDVIELIRTGQLSPTHGVALLRYGAAPAVVSALAAIVVRDHIPTAQIESGMVWERHAYVLQTQGMIVSFGRPEFDAAVCDRCPFDALVVHKTNWGTSRTCVRPEHYRELTEAARAAATAAREAALAEAAAGHDGAPAKPVALESLKWGEYTAIHPSMRPVGCTDACSCVQLAVGFDGQLGPICVNPQRYRTLQAADERAKTKARKTAAAALLTEVQTAMDQVAEVTGREVALLAAFVAGNLPGGSYQKRAAERHLPGFDGGEFVAYGEGAIDSPAKLAELADHDPVALVRFAVEAYLTRLVSRWGEDGYTLPAAAQWYLGRGSAELDRESRGERRPLHPKRPSAQGGSPHDHQT